MYSIYSTTNEFVKGLKMSSINCMKVSWAFINLKGMTIHSKRPSLYLKEIFHMSEGSIGTLVIIRIQLSFAEIFNLLNVVQNDIKPWEWIPILISDLIQHSIVNREPPHSILLLYQ